jgi:hypothetical protein
MKNKATIKEYNLMLQQYIDRKTYVKIFRTVCGKEENLSGFILGMSKRLLLLQLDNEFTLDGYAVIRLDDFDSIRHSSYERTQQKIFRTEALLSTGYGFDQPLPLTSWTALLKALKGYDLHVVVENINKDFLDFWIGPIKRVSEKSVSIHNYNPDGQLDAKPTAILLETISVLKFGDRYSTIFRKYLKSANRH